VKEETSPVKIQAVIWDFGGVLTSSPFEAFARYEAEAGLPKDFIRTVNATNPTDNAWAKFERAEINADTFDALFRGEAIALGHDVPGSVVLPLLSGDLRPAVVAALRQCKQHFKVGCITNNVPIGHGAGMSITTEKANAVGDVMALFDYIIESSKLGIRKPDPRIYALMCEALAVDPASCVYLDDLGINLKPARQMGMATIKVASGAQALSELSAVTGLTFL
jgi:putative hydrolase of the HAD superfamily